MSLFFNLSQFVTQDPNTQVCGTCGTGQKCVSDDKITWRCETEGEIKKNRHFLIDHISKLGHLKFRCQFIPKIGKLDVPALFSYF